MSLSADIKIKIPVIVADLHLGVLQVNFGQFSRGNYVLNRAIWNIISRVVNFWEWGSTVAWVNWDVHFWLGSTGGIGVVLEESNVGSDKGVFTGSFVWLFSLGGSVDLDALIRCDIISSKAEIILEYNMLSKCSWGSLSITFSETFFFLLACHFLNFFDRGS